MHISKYIRFGDTLERCCKGKAFIWIVQGFWKKNAEMEVVFNRCWVFRSGQGTCPCPLSTTSIVP